MTKLTETTIEQEVAGCITRALESDDQLPAAFNMLAERYRTDASLRWHGVNAIALQQRATRLGLNLEHPFETDDVALELAASVDSQGPSIEDGSIDPRELITAAWAHLAVRNPRKALAYTIEYVHRSKADEAVLTWLLRDLTELWGLNEFDLPGRPVIAFVQAELLQREGGRIEARPRRQRPAQLKRILGNALYKTVLGDDACRNIKSLAAGFTCAQSVAAIHDAAGHEIGAAVVVRPAAVGVGPTVDLVDQECLLLTSSRTVGTAEDNQGAPDVYFRLDLDDTTGPYTIAEVIECGSTDDLESVLVRTEPPLIDHPTVRLASELPPPGELVYAVGPPHGEASRASLSALQLLDRVDDNLIATTPDDEALPGTPIMNDRWRLVAIHQGADATIDLRDPQPRPATVATRIEAIVDAVAERCFAPQRKTP